MSSSSLQTRIRRIAGDRGADPLAALRAADAAAALQNNISPDTAVVWPDEAGGIAWEALTAGGRQAGELSDTAPRKIRMVFGPDGPADPALWKNIAGFLAERSVTLTLSILEDGVPKHSPDPVPEGVGEKPAVRILKWILKRIEPSIPEVPEQAASTEIRTSDRFILADAESLDRSLRLGSGSMAEPADLPDGFFQVAGRTPLRERLAAAEVLMLSGIVPVIPMSSGEVSESLDTVSRLAASKAPFAVSLSASWSSLSRFTGTGNLALLSPGNSDDRAAALQWIEESGVGAVILDPGKGAHPERRVFHRDWETGRGIIIRESLKGSAGRILLVVPGRSALIASKAADRLVKDNISVSVLCMRFLSPICDAPLESLVSDSDLVAVLEESGFPGDLRGRFLSLMARQNSRKLLMVPDGTDAPQLAVLASRELREQRLKRTVDDVKADRWR